MGLVALAWPLLVGFGLPTRAAREVRSGNQAYEQGDYGRALEHYRDALTAEPTESVINFNAGDALYKQERYKEAIEQYEQALGGGGERDAVTHYNLGNAQYQMGDYAAAAESYKRSLALDPSDQWAKFNLEMALRKLKGQQPQQQESEQQRQEEKQQEEEQKKEGEGEEQESQQQQAQGQQGEEQQGEGQEQTGEARPMTKEEARRLFQAIMDEDEALQKQIRQVQAQISAAPQGRDW